MIHSKCSTQRATQKAIRSGNYLVRGVKERSLFLSEGEGGDSSGVWATNSIEAARVFGDELELVPKPKHVFVSDMFELARLVGEDDFSHLTKEEWSQLRRMLLDRGYDGVNLAIGHLDEADDYWILREDVERVPVCPTESYRRGSNVPGSGKKPCSDAGLTSE
jgi:hypothetical protein